MPEKRPYSDEIDIRQILRSLLEKKKTITVGVLLCTFLSLIISFVVPQSYESTGFFSFSSVDIPRFQIYEGLYKNPGMLKSFIEKYYKEDDWVISNSVFEDSYEPIYAYGMNPRNLVKDNSVIGLRVTSSGNSPEKAKSRVDVLGKYMSTTILNMSMWQYYSQFRTKLEGEITEKKNEIIECNQEIKSLKQKLELLNEANSESINSSLNYGRNVIQVDANTEKYLPLKQQAIAAKITISNLVEVIIRKNREIETSNQLLGFLSKINVYFDFEEGFLIEEHLLDTIIKTKERYFFHLQNIQDVEKAILIVEQKVAEFVGIRTTTLRFLSGPSFPERPAKPSKSLIVFSVFFISIICFVIYSVFLSWWEKRED